MQRGKELLVGLFIVLSIFSLIAFLFIFDKVNVENKFYTLKIEFNDVGSLELGTHVILGGVKIGKVKAIYLENEKVVVEAEIEKKIEIKKGAKITILIKGLIGDLVLGVINSGENTEHYLDGARIQGEDPVSMNSLLEKTYMMLETMELLQKKLETVSFENTSQIVSNLDLASRKLNETLDSTKKLTESANKIIVENEKSIALLIKNSNKLIERIDLLVDKRDKDLETVIIMIKDLLLSTKLILNKNEKDISKIVYNFEKISKRTLSLVKSIDKEEIKVFYKDLKKISSDISQISQDVKKQLKGDSVKNLSKSIENSKEITEKINTILDIKLKGGIEFEYNGVDNSDFNINLNMERKNYYLKLKKENLNNDYGLSTVVFGKRIKRNSVGVGIIRDKGGLVYRYKLNPNWDFNFTIYDNINQNIIIGTEYSVKRYKVYLKYDIENMKENLDEKLRIGIGYEF